MIEVDFMLEVDRGMTWDAIKQMIRDCGGAMTHEQYLRKRHLYGYKEIQIQVPPAIFLALTKRKFMV